MMLISPNERGLLRRLTQGPLRLDGVCDWQLATLRKLARSGLVVLDGEPRRFIITERGREEIS